MATLTSYKRSIITAVLLALVLSFAFSSLRVDVWVALQPFFQWMETTWFGSIGKTWGAAFAVIEAVHLLALAVLGGSVIFADGRLLGVIFSEVPARTIVDHSHRLFICALLVMILTGVFMACAVAMKIYYLPVYWYKMLALATGILYVFFIRRPLLAGNIDELNPLVVKLVAVSSLMIWFTVAATGRWIGFSG
ncbi:MAG: DUF6644 family protein [Pseudohongiellaceae bacterium]